MTQEQEQAALTQSTNIQEVATTVVSLASSAQQMGQQLGGYHGVSRGTVTGSVLQPEVERNRVE